VTSPAAPATAACGRVG